MFSRDVGSILREGIFLYLKNVNLGFRKSWSEYEEFWECWKLFLIIIRYFSKWIKRLLEIYKVENIVLENNDDDN